MYEVITKAEDAIALPFWFMFDYQCVVLYLIYITVRYRTVTVQYWTRNPHHLLIAEYLNKLCIVKLESTNA